MSTTVFRGSRRAATIVCAAAAIACALSATLHASEITATDDFRAVAAAVAKYAHEFGPDRVLLVLDIDNTLLAMDHDLGSDQWFEWQRYLLEHEPRSDDLVVNSFDELLEAQGLLFSVGRMHPPQRDLPTIISRLQGRGIYTLLLTARGREFRAATERELRRNAYDFASTSLPVRNLPGGSYLPYNLDDLEADGLTERDVAALDLTEPQPVTYEGGIYMTAGQPKGAMLLAMLHHADADIRAVVYADDQIRHVAYVFAAVAGRGVEVTGFHYTREEPRMKRFQFGNKEEVGRRWRKLSRALEDVFE